MSSSRVFDSTLAQHTPWTRARAVSVFRQCIFTLMMVKAQHPQAVKEATESILPVWIDALKTILNTPPEEDVQNVETWDGLAIRIEIFKVQFNSLARPKLLIHPSCIGIRYNSHQLPEITSSALH